MTNDFINGCFEAIGALAICTSTYTIYKDKCHAGVSKYNLLFFTSWSLFNLYFYPSAGLHWSFLGGCCIVIANTIYLICLWYYPHALAKDRVYGGMENH